MSAERCTWRRTKSGKWAIFGPKAEVFEGAEVTVHKASGATSRETIGSVGKTFTADGVACCYGYKGEAPKKATPERRKSRPRLELVEPVEETGYRFHRDIGHGWLEVPSYELNELRITNRISRFSYLRNGAVYLEEDADANIFCEAYEDRYGERPAIKYVEYQGDAPIRTYGRFPQAPDYRSPFEKEPEPEPEIVPVPENTDDLSFWL